MTTALAKRIDTLDVVGSFLRLANLKAARRDYQNHEIGADYLERVTDAAIREFVDQEIAAGLTIVTDGEFRRAIYSYDTVWSLLVLNQSPSPTESNFTTILKPARSVPE